MESHDAIQQVTTFDDISHINRDAQFSAAAGQIYR